MNNLQCLNHNTSNPLDNYIIEQSIGKGTFGKVYRGLHKPTQQFVAIKILEKSKIEQPADFTRIQREIHILRKLRHPNIVQLYEILESETKIYLIMEFVSGGELFQHIVKNKRLSENEAAALFSQIIEAIEYLHSLKVAHRDLKPENLLLENNNLKVVDFGLSNIYTDQLSTPCGSPCYAAPEMVSGISYQGIKTDIWASGIILYAMLCGYVPFEDQNTRKLYEKIKHSDFQKPSHLSIQVIDLLQGLLNKNPLNRFTIAKIKMHPFVSKYSYSIQIHRTLAINQNIIKQLQAIGIDSEKCKEMIINNKHNPITTTYHLLNKLQQPNKQTQRVRTHQSIKSVVDKPINSIERKPNLSIYHNKTKSYENNYTTAMIMKKEYDNRISERPKSTERRVCTENDRWERIKTQYETKENSSRKTHMSKPSKQPVMYAEYKLKTARIIFILKTYNILENNMYEDIVSWNQDGLSFTVKNISQFSSIVLPIHFKHQNFSSFIRQLNMYDFHKSRGGSVNEFKNEYFQKGRKDLLNQIKRKQHNELIPINQSVQHDSSDQLNQLSQKCDYLHNLCSSLLKRNYKVMKDNKILQKVLISHNKLQLQDELNQPDQLCITNEELTNNIE
ncbi:unnamed protein product [Paramecium pentaurelia]|uniref:non-specific serine/threonine protein kinase n=1 Tax=Paramecium pentaurelia TaxID=43138 RepID=A0A8S1V197_9CILI|nr:unnamed protein product [Paramecium pentaurelia]